MKLKIKMKTLIGLIIFTLFLVLIIVPLGNLRMGIYLNEKGSEKAGIFFKNYMASPIRVIEKQGLYEYGNSLVKGFDKYKISFSGWGGGERATPADMKEAMDLFEEVLKKDEKNNYKSDYSIKSYTKLLDTSIVILDMDRLIHWIDWGKDRDNMEINNISRLYEAYYYFAQKDYRRAEEILESYKKEEGDIKYYNLMGDIHVQLGNMEKARDYYEVSESANLSPKSRGPGAYFGGGSLYFSSFEVEEYMEKLGGDHKISGKISYNGKGLPFVDVYIDKRLGYFFSGGQKPNAITDENGEYEIQGVKDGAYGISIGIHSSQLYNKVFLRKDIRSVELNKDIELDFCFVSPMEIIDPKNKLAIGEDEDINITWEPLEGADYYSLESIMFTDPRKKSGNSSRLALKDKNGNDKFKNNNMILNIGSQDKRLSGLSFEGEEGIVSPTGILGSFIPDGEYPLVVNAYNGEDELIASSLPLISDYEDMVSMEVEGELTKGESLILAKKYQEAISHYEEKLIEDPKDKEALLYLSRIYAIGWKKGEKDTGKGLKYGQKYDKNYDDHNLSLELISGMWREELADNKEIVGNILENMPEEDKDTNYYSQKGRYYLVEKELERARSSYMKMTDYKSKNILYIDMYLENYEEAIAVLEDEKLEIMKMNKGKVIEALTIMEDIPAKDKELFKKLLKAILTDNLSRYEEKALYNETRKNLTSVNLKEILDEISKEEYWNENY